MVILTTVGNALAAIAGRIEHLDARLVASALLLQLAVLVLRAFAWRNVLVTGCRQRISPLTVLCAYATGVALNGFLPARGGEAAKVGIVRARVPGSRVATIAGSLSVICLLDAVIAATLVVGLWSTGLIPALPVPPVPTSLRTLLLVALGVLLGGVVAFLVARRFSISFREVGRSVLRGMSILRSPWRIAYAVLPFLFGAWACRLLAVYLALDAFHIHASLATAALVMVLAGASAAVPVPGGGGSQQLFATYALRGAAPVAGAMSFSFAMQVGVTVLNTTVGVVAAMILFRTLRPLTALRAARAPAA